MKTKICSHCGRELLLSEFYRRNKGSKSGRHSWCKKCSKIWVTKWRQKNPERDAHIIRRMKYGIEPEDFAALLRKQSGVCAICGQPETRILREKVCSLGVDHDHKTGKIRGLLCFRCNTVIGRVEENVGLLRQMIVYIKERCKGEI